MLYNKFYYRTTDLNSLIDEFFKITKDEINLFSPDVDVIENSDNYQFQLSLPGFEKENININIDNNLLKISGERKINSDLKYNKKESFYGKLDKSYKLPENVDVDSINAKFLNGILVLTINKINKETKNIVIN